MAAVDLGASSGRVMAGRYHDGRLEIREAARFANGPVLLPTVPGPRLYWPVLHLWESICDGLMAASHGGDGLASVAIDTWAVDYGLLNADCEMMGNPASYRCGRTDGAPERFFAHLSAPETYKEVGLQVQQFNTVFQMLAEPRATLRAASRLLLMPDLFGHWLTGHEVAEVTNASTTGMLDPRTRTWSMPILDALREGFGRHVEHLLPELVEPGTVIGPVQFMGLDVGAPELVAVGSHDTASAVVAVPAEREDFAYISSGTWSLVGLELDEPVLTEGARLANLTNELGVDKTVRFLKNVMGLWVFNEAVRTWRGRGESVDVPRLVAQAADCPELRTVVDVNADGFFPPGDMAARVIQAARSTDQPEPEAPAEVARCIFDSLALAYRRAVRSASRIAGRQVGVIHMVGGGVNNKLLCQLTADATQLPVVAGPVEGTALGNLVVQARALGHVEGGLHDLRQVIKRSSDLVTYHPRPGSEKPWEEAERRLFG